MKKEKSIKTLSMVSKRIILVLISICMLINLTACKSTSTNNFNMLYVLDDLEFASDLSVNSKGELFIVGDGKIFVYDAEGEISNSFGIDGHFITNLHIDNKEIAVIDSFHNRIFILNAAGEVLSEKSYTLQFEEIDKIRKIDDTVFILGMEKGTDNREQQKVLLKYNLSSGSEEEVNVDAINNFCIYDKSSLLLQIGRANDRFMTFDIKSNTTGKELTFGNAIITSNYIWDFEYDSKRKSLFYISDKALYSIKESNNSSPEFIEKLYDSSRGCKISMSKESVFVLNPSEGILEILGKNPSEKGENALITIMDSADPRLNRKFEEEFSVTVVNEQAFSFSQSNNFVVKLLSGDSSFDIYELNSNSMNSYNLLKNNLFYDLSESEIIKNYVDSSFSRIKDFSYYEGKLIGVPLWSQTEAMFYNEKILEKYNVKVEDIVTWHDFFDVLNKIAEDEDAAHGFYINKYHIEDSIFKQYIYSYNDIYNGIINFDTPEFRNTLMLMKKVFTNSYFQDSDSEPSSYGINDNDALSIVYTGDVKPETDKAFLPIPTIDRERQVKSNVSISWAVINPRSKNKDLAIKYLETLCKNIYLSLNHSTIGKHATESSDINPSPIWYTGYDNLLTNSIVNFEHNIQGSINPILDDFYLDMIDIDEAIKLINEKVTMMLME